MDSRTVALAIVLACGVSAAEAADPVYKSTMPDGRVIYGESPQPGAKRVDKVAAPPETTGVEVVTSKDKERANAIQLPERASVTVIPQPVRPPTQSPAAGQSFNPQDKLPSRGY